MSLYIDMDCPQTPVTLYGLSWDTCHYTSTWTVPRHLPLYMCKDYLQDTCHYKPTLTVLGCLSHTSIYIDRLRMPVTTYLHGLSHDVCHYTSTFTILGHLSLYVCGD